MSRVATAPRFDPRPGRATSRGPARSESWRRIDTPLDLLFEEPPHVVESFLADPDCRLEDAFSSLYKYV